MKIQKKIEMRQKVESYVRRYCIFLAWVVVLRLRCAARASSGRLDVWGTVVVFLFLRSRTGARLPIHHYSIHLYIRTVWIRY